MSRRHDLGDLLAGVDIADMAGVGKACVANWRIRHEDFPQPIVVVGRGNMPIFSHREVLEWLARTDRLPHTLRRDT
jgi:hypothetical protein